MAAKKSRKTKIKKAPKEKYEVVLRSYKAGKPPVEKRFVVAKGEKLRTIKDALHSFERMTENALKGHISAFKEDFSGWLRNAFDEKMLLREVKKMRDRFKAQRKTLENFFTKLDKLSKKALKKK